MAISGISNAAQIQASGAVGQPSWQTRMQQMLGPVAQLFGMTTSQLEQSLQSGQSLSDIATSKGVSQADLLSAIKAGMQQGRPAGAPSLSDAQLTNLATGIANRHHHDHDVASSSASSAAATSGSATSSPSALAAVEQDLQQLLQDLGTALSTANTNGAGSSDTALGTMPAQTTVDQLL